MRRWWTPAASDAAVRLSVRYWKTSGVESTGSSSDASDSVGKLPGSTACFGAPILPSKRSREAGGQDDAKRHLHLASHHGWPSFPCEGDRIAERSLQHSILQAGFLKVKPVFVEKIVQIEGDGRASFRCAYLFAGTESELAANAQTYPEAGESRSQAR